LFIHINKYLLFCKILNYLIKKYIVPAPITPPIPTQIITSPLLIKKLPILPQKLGFNCSPHSGRHTFATLANEYELNEFLIKRIMGHSTKDLTKDVYTRTDKERLIKEIEKLPCLR
jgi:integrase